MNPNAQQPTVVGKLAECVANREKYYTNDKTTKWTV